MDVLGTKIKTSIEDIITNNFIVSETFIQSQYDELHYAIVQKIPFYEVISTIKQQLEDLHVGIGEPPEFTVTMPSKFGGQTYSIIDFTFYDDYRITIHTWIKFGGWFFVLFKVIKRLPTYIYN